MRTASLEQQKRGKLSLPAKGQVLRTLSYEWYLKLFGHLAYQYIFIQVEAIKL